MKQWESNPRASHETGSFKSLWSRGGDGEPDRPVKDDRASPLRLRLEPSRPVEELADACGDGQVHPASLRGAAAEPFEDLGAKLHRSDGSRRCTVECDLDDPSLRVAAERHADRIIVRR